MYFAVHADVFTVDNAFASVEFTDDNSVALVPTS